MRAIFKRRKKSFSKARAEKETGLFKKKENSTFDQDNMFKIEILLIDQLL